MFLTDAWRVPLQAVRQWPTHSQLGARRNAMVACTAMARHRAEVAEVDALLGHRVPQQRVGLHEHGADAVPVGSRTSHG